MSRVVSHLRSVRGVLFLSAVFAAACSQQSAGPSQARKEGLSSGHATAAPIYAVNRLGSVQGQAAGDVKSGSGDLEFFNLRLDRQTSAGSSILRQYANPGGEYEIQPGEVIELWAEYRGAANPRFIVNWGDGSDDFINCGSCLMKHAYSRTGRFTVRAVLDDRVSTTVTRTFALFTQTDAEGLVGSFLVGDGPYWKDNPTAVSCVEACASLFGGTAGSYRCSTVASSVNSLAFVDGYADEQYCTNPVSDTFKLGTGYDCGDTGCSYSAYVLDHGIYPGEYEGPCGFARNYCFR